MKYTDYDCLIFDFQDSFTYNIASELKSLGIKSKVIAYENVAEVYQLLKNSSDKKVLIHGPGPGHPNDYSHLFVDLNKLLDKKNFFHLGICLGHQMMMIKEGGVIKKSSNPMHGRKITFTLPAWPVFSPKDWGKAVTVQRYNSLSLAKTDLKLMREANDLLYVVHDDDVLMTYAENKLSYQFHPESVGTTCPFVFFGALKSFLYN